jgi:alpha-1,3-rhamnosyl/mannosyltransferase
MKIIVNAIPLTGLLTGISRYVRCLYATIQQANDVSVTYFTGNSPIQAMPSQAEPVTWSKRTHRVWQLPDIFITTIRTLHWLNFERRLKNVCSSNTYDLYHETAFFPAALKDTIPVVYTIYDNSLLKYKNEHPRERVWFFNLFFKKRLPYATHIITISEFIRNELIDELSIAPDKITTIPLAADQFFYPRQKDSIDEMLNRNRWPQEYILYVGTLEPRKNLPVLIKALSMTKTNITLILAGWKGWGDKRWIENINVYGLKDRVIFTDYVDEETLACLYTGASAFVYPSLYEGFGLPILEAMSCGCPVICSNRASLPEVAGDAALLIDPTDPQRIASSIDLLAGDASKRSKMADDGLKRAKLFNWGKTAELTLSIFNEVNNQYIKLNKKYYN